MKKKLHSTVALVLPPSGEDWNLATARITGVPVFIRSLHAAEKAGVKLFFVLISADKKKQVLESLQNIKHLPQQIDWIDRDNPNQLKKLYHRQSAPLVVFNANLLFDFRILQRMDESFHRESQQLVIPNFSNNHLSTLGKTRLAIISPALLPNLFSRMSTQWPNLDEGIRDFEQKEVNLPKNWLYLEIVSENFPCAVDILLSHLGKPDDNLVIHYVRKISAKIAKLLAYTPIKPNHVTVFAFLLGMLAAFFIYQASYGWVISGALLFVISWVIDCADGMLARLKLEETPLGAWLDIVLDNVVHLAIFAALTKVVHTQTSYKEIVVYGGGLLIFGACLSFAMVVYSRAQKNKLSHINKSKSDKIIETILEHLTHRDFCLWILLFALINHLEIFFWASVVGVNLFGGLFLYLNIKMSRVHEVS